MERLEVRVGVDVIHAVRPYSEADLGRRVKVIWRGAEVRGRDRIAAWDGGLRVMGNAIRKAVPVNFWNANRPLEMMGDRELAWKSVTTGGICGVILELENPESGNLEICTTQGAVSCPVAALGIEPLSWDFGGLEKRIDVYPLPDTQPDWEISTSLPLDNLSAGDNPILVHLVQEDGHMAWSSPVYVVVEDVN